MEVIEKLTFANYEFIIVIFIKNYFYIFMI
jgi:hypothetical protein